jgi:hypothetical protein
VGPDELDLVRLLVLAFNDELRLGGKVLVDVDDAAELEVEVALLQRVLLVTHLGVLICLVDVL